MKKNVYGGAKLAFHKEKIEALSNNQVTAPISVRIKPTNKCSHKCFYCAYQPEFGLTVSEKFNFKDKIPKEKMMEILDDFKEIGVKAITYAGGGEPLMYPHIIGAMKKNLEYKIDFSIITNGQFLRNEKAEILAQSEWTRISSSEIDAKTF